MHRYQTHKLLGDGTYGDVFQAVHKTSGEVVAIKKLKRRYSSWEECKNLGEVKCLRQLKHPNVVKLKEVIRERNGELYFVFEFMKMNLYELMKERRRLLPESKIRAIMLQIIKGLLYMHSEGYFHRDLKPENVLVSDDAVKLADFGLVRETQSEPPYTDYVSTRWYRAPEVLVQCKYYGPSIDMWACGTIMAELYTLRPLFPGSSEIDEIHKICKIMGTPTSVDWADGVRQAKRIGLRFMQCRPKDLSQLIPNASPSGVDLLHKLMRYNPHKRLTAKQALQHPFFRSNQPQPCLHPADVSTPRMKTRSATRAAKALRDSGALQSTKFGAVGASQGPAAAAPGEAVHGNGHALLASKENLHRKATERPVLPPLPIHGRTKDMADEYKLRGFKIKRKRQKAVHMQSSTRSEPMTLRRRKPRSLEPVIPKQKGRGRFPNLRPLANRIHHH